MGTNVELMRYNYDKLVKELMKVPGIDNKEILERILLEFGEKINDQYILLNNEFWEDYNCYYNVSIVIDNVFKCKDSFDIFCFNKNIDEVEMIGAVEIESAVEALEDILIGKYKYIEDELQ